MNPTQLADKPRRPSASAGGVFVPSSPTSGTPIFMAGNRGSSNEERPDSFWSLRVTNT
ncbi:MAG: hypothetical protein ACAI43_02425 [Phycisphaerae bacterium]|nr:hypothetical protein [Tepidisphaeraceae bacterium]